MMSPPIPAGPATVILTHLASLPEARGVALAFPLRLSSLEATAWEAQASTPKMATMADSLRFMHFLNEIGTSTRVCSVGSFVKNTRPGRQDVPGA